MLNEAFGDTLSAAQNGDERSFALIFRDVQPPLIRYLLAKAPDIADDVASEVWLEVVRGLRAFEGDERGFRAWVFTIARAKVIDRLRYESRRPTVPLEGTDFEFPAGRDVVETILEEAATQQVIALVRGLSPDQADVVMLRVVAGLGNAEIAAILNRSTGSVRVLAHRGLRRLAKTLRAQVKGGVTE
jgi:RNA polymerase sigma-70 factor (ECF subfamily)